MIINFTTQVWKEGDKYVSYAPELDVSSCGESVDQAKKNLLETVECLIETAEQMGTLEEILEESGFVKKGKMWEAPQVVSTEKTKLEITK
jgi:predicted RNase H-like HicB family nuclease